MEQKLKEIAKEFRNAFLTRKAEGLRMIQVWLDFEKERHAKNKASLPVRGENTKKARDDERMADAKWDAANPYPETMKDARAIAILAGLADRWLDELADMNKFGVPLIPDDFRENTMDDVLLCAIEAENEETASEQWARVQEMWIVQGEPKKKGKTGPRKRGKKHNLTGREKGSVASLIREIRGGKRKQGEEPPTDKEVVAELLERAKTHPLLKERTMPGFRTLEGWVSNVRRGLTIPRAHR